MERTDIVLLTCNRIKFLKQVIKYFEERLHSPYRLIIINNNSKDGTTEYSQELKSNAEYPIEIIHNKDGEEKGLCAAYTQSLDIVESELFITTQDDLLIPDLEPDVLVKLIDLFNKNPRYGAICLRTNNMARGPVGNEELIHRIRTCPGVFRIQRKSDMLKIGGFGSSRRWEDSEMCKIMNNFGKKVAISSNLWARDIGLEADRGYPEWYREKVKDNFNRNFEWVAKNRVVRNVGKVDNKTHKPI